MNKHPSCMTVSAYSVLSSYSVLSFPFPTSFLPHLNQAHKGSTLWCVRHLPQNRDVFMTSGGGTLHLWK